MAKRMRKRKCPSCGVFFTPDHRNWRRQRYCSKPECRKAAKAASQKLWLQKPENRNYFRGPDNVRRIQEWRKAHPGYSRKKREALQDHLSGKPVESPTVKPSFATTALQDLFTSQVTVLVGLSIRVKSALDSYLVQAPAESALRTAVIQFVSDYK